MILHALPVTKPPALTWEDWHQLSQVNRHRLSQRYYATVKPDTRRMLLVKYGLAVDLRQTPPRCERKVA